LKLDGVTLLGSDSRAYDGTEVVTDSEPKVFRLSRNLFYGYSGYRDLGSRQVNVAATLEQTDNLFAFADKLDAAILPDVERLAEERAVKQSPQDRTALHAYILIGANGGIPGFLGRTFWLRAGRIWREEQYNFEPPSNSPVCVSTSMALLGDLPNQLEAWVGRTLPQVAEFLVSHVQHQDPLVGGPVQLACVDQSGGRWVNQLFQENSYKAAPVDGKVVAALADGLTIVNNKIAPNLGSALQINSTTKQLEVANVDIARFAASVRPVAIFTSDPALPDANYPAGTFGINVTTHVFKRVNDAGNAWVLAVDGAKDIVAGSITAAAVNTASLATAFATITYLTSNYITASAIAASYATFSYLSTNYLTASSIAANYATISALNAKRINVDHLDAGDANFSSDASFTRSGGPTLVLGSSQIAYRQGGNTFVNITPSTPSVNVYDPLNGYALGARLLAYGGGSLALSGSGGNASINCGSGNPVMYMGPNQVLTVRYTGSVTTLADVIQVLRWHGLCN
jgi:hypothetical protein